MRWYVSHNGETVGPIEGQDLAERIRRGEVHVAAFVRDEAASAWTPLGGSPFANIAPATVPPAPSTARPRSAWNHVQNAVICSVAVAALAIYWALGEKSEPSVITTAQHEENERRRLAAAKAEGQTDPVPFYQPAEGSQSEGAAVRELMLQQVARAMNEARDPPYAVGPDQTVVIPSNDPAKCLIWGSMWHRQTGKELRDVGFTELRCGSRVWKL